MEYLRQTLQGRPLISIGVHAIEPGTGALCRSPVKQRTTMNVVSMSWWMSQPVQAYLDAQLCAPEIDQILICELKRGINSKGELSGSWAFGQRGRMRELLEQESVVFSAEGRVDLKRFGWDPSRDLSDDERAEILASADSAPADVDDELLRLLMDDPASPFRIQPTGR